MKHRPNILIFGNEIPNDIECEWKGNRAQYYYTNDTYVENPEQDLIFWNHRKASAFDQLIGSHGKRKLCPALDEVCRPMKKAKLSPFWGHVSVPS